MRSLRDSLTSTLSAPLRAAVVAAAAGASATTNSAILGSTTSASTSNNNNNSSMVDCCVHFLDDSHHTFQVQKTITGAELLCKVLKFSGICDSSGRYFNLYELAYENSQPNLRKWLNLKKTLGEQLKRSYRGGGGRRLPNRRLQSQQRMTAHNRPTAINSGKLSPSQLDHRHCNVVVAGGSDVPMNSEQRQHATESSSTSALKLMRLIKKPKCIYAFQFGVQFYPEQPTPRAVADEYARYLIFLQLRQDLATGRLLAPINTIAPLLCSYIVQAELGDFNTAEHKPVPLYIDHQFNSNLLPANTFQNNYSAYDAFLWQVHKLHVAHAGQTPADAELEFLQTAAKLAHYGLFTVRARILSGFEANAALGSISDSYVVVGVSHAGIMIFRDPSSSTTATVSDLIYNSNVDDADDAVDSCHVHSPHFIIDPIYEVDWSQIVKISFKRKQFVVEVQPPSSSIPQTTTTTNAESIANQSENYELHSCAVKKRQSFQQRGAAAATANRQYQQQSRWLLHATGGGGGGTSSHHHRQQQNQIDSGLHSTSTVSSSGCCSASNNSTSVAFRSSDTNNNTANTTNINAAVRGGGVSSRSSSLSVHNITNNNNGRLYDNDDDNDSGSAENLHAAEELANSAAMAAAAAATRRDNHDEFRNYYSQIGCGLVNMVAVAAKSTRAKRVRNRFMRRHNNNNNNINLTAVKSRKAALLRQRKGAEFQNNNNIVDNNNNKGDDDNMVEFAQLTFSLESPRVCKALWKNCIEKHTFYRLHADSNELNGGAAAADSTMITTAGSEFDHGHTASLNIMHDSVGAGPHRRPRIIDNILSIGSRLRQSGGSGRMRYHYQCNINTAGEQRANAQQQQQPLNADKANNKTNLHGGRDINNTSNMIMTVPLQPQEKDADNNNCNNTHFNRGFMPSAAAATVNQLQRQEQQQQLLLENSSAASNAATPTASTIFNNGIVLNHDQQQQQQHHSRTTSCGDVTLVNNINNEEDRTNSVLSSRTDTNINNKSSFSRATTASPTAMTARNICQTRTAASQLMQQPQQQQPQPHQQQRQHRQQAIVIPTPSLSKFNALTQFCRRTVNFIASSSSSHTLSAFLDNNPAATGPPDADIVRVVTGTDAVRQNDAERRYTSPMLTAKHATPILEDDDLGANLNSKAAWKRRFGKLLSNLQHEPSSSSSRYFEDDSNLILNNSVDKGAAAAAASSYSPSLRSATTTSDGDGRFLPPSATGGRRLSNTSSPLIQAARNAKRFQESPRRARRVAARPVIASNSRAAAITSDETTPYTISQQCVMPPGVRGAKITNIIRAQQRKNSGATSISSTGGGREENSSSQLWQQQQQHELTDVNPPMPDLLLLHRTTKQPQTASTPVSTANSSPVVGGSKLPPPPASSFVTPVKVKPFVGSGTAAAACIYESPSHNNKNTQLRNVPSAASSICSSTGSTVVQQQQLAAWKPGGAGGNNLASAANHRLPVASAAAVVAACSTAAANSSRHCTPVVRSVSAHGGETPPAPSSTSSGITHATRVGGEFVSLSPSAAAISSGTTVMMTTTTSATVSPNQMHLRHRRGMSVWKRSLPPLLFTSSSSTTTSTTTNDCSNNNNASTVIIQNSSISTTTASNDAAANAASTATMQPLIMNEPFVCCRLKPDAEGRFGFNVRGGVDLRSPVIVTRVVPYSPADLAEPTALREGDEILQICKMPTCACSHEEVVTMIKESWKHPKWNGTLELVIRPGSFYDYAELEKRPGAAVNATDDGGLNTPGSSTAAVGFSATTPLLTLPSPMCSLPPPPSTLLPFAAAALSSSINNDAGGCAEASANLSLVKEVKTPALTLSESVEILRASLAAQTALEDFEKVYRKNVDMLITRACLAENCAKNRYRDVLPYDETRVLLKPIVAAAAAASPTEVAVGDYINANYVKMVIPKSGVVNHYIATQGPLPSTTNDFWQMVWQEDANLIVMLTQLAEQGRQKCHQYWPALHDTPLEVGGGVLQIKCNAECFMYDMAATTELSSAPPNVSVDAEKVPFSCRRELVLVHKLTGEERHLTHLQYLTWPDHGVPTHDSINFLQFTAEVRRRRAGHELGAPTIIHCSAGIGRTGVLIFAETAMCLIEAGEPIEPLSIVQRMRDQRSMLIQTTAQYEFVLTCVLRAFDEKMVVPAALPTATSSSSTAPTERGVLLAGAGGAECVNESLLSPNATAVMLLNNNKDDDDDEAEASRSSTTLSSDDDDDETNDDFSSLLALSTSNQIRKQSLNSMPPYTALNGNLSNSGGSVELLLPQQSLTSAVKNHQNLVAVRPSNSHEFLPAGGRKRSVESVGKAAVTAAAAAAASSASTSTTNLVDNAIPTYRCTLHQIHPATPVVKNVHHAAAGFSFADNSNNINNINSNLNNSSSILHEVDKAPLSTSVSASFLT